jgi:flagellar basal-body rod protein FlgC
MNILPAIGITSDALAAEKVRLEVIGQNIANAQTTRGPDGRAYQRKIVSFEAQLQHGAGLDGNRGTPSLRVASITADPTPGDEVYMPGHPHADSNGMVRLPNVNVAREMVDLVTASRAFEANLSVVRTSRQMAIKALQIGR